MPKRMLFIVLILILIFLRSAGAYASEAYSFSDSNTVLGDTGSHVIEEGETLHELARDYDLGYNEIVAANPALDPWLPADGVEVTMPFMWVLPGDTREGIVVNLAEMRLFHYFDSKNGKLVKTYPIGVGVEGFETRPDVYSIKEKLTDPIWYVPESIRKERPEYPAKVLPGYDNPLGNLALVLSDSGYMIHGTNAPYGIGRRVSHGCIRMYPEDIGELFWAVKRKTKVTIVYEPIKIGVRGEEIYVEVHEDYLDSVRNPIYYSITRLGEEAINEIDRDTLKKALNNKTGIPVRIK